jgi:hypothetical protein
VLLASLAVGCNHSLRVGPRGDGVEGSGRRKTERRDVAEFDRITVEGAYRVEVACGRERGLEIEADDNLLPLLLTDVEGGRLRLHNERGITTKQMPLVRVTVPDLKEVSVPGASDFSLTGVRNERLEVKVEGAAKLRASGETGALDLTLSGAGLVDARDLHAREVSVVNSGAGMTSVYATERLDATVNGVGTVDYYGDPQTVNPQVNGLGKITKK